MKSVSGHPRVENESHILRRFQSRSSYIRPLLDEIEEHQPDTTTIVLKHLDAHLQQASMEKALNRREIKFVLRRVLEALSVLHEEGYVHTGE